MKTMKEYISTPEGVSQMWEKINEILDNFDFNKVAAVMETLDWTWACTEEEGNDYAEQGCHVEFGKGVMGGCEYRPEYPQLLRNARNLILQTIQDMPDDEREWGTETGGFKVQVFISTDEERMDYYGEPGGGDIDDFAHSVDIALYFIVEDWKTF